MKTRRFLAIALATALAAAPRPATAQAPSEQAPAEQAPAAPDTSLGGFIGAFSDSTDRYFGISAAPVDTAGLDTVLFDSALRPPRRLKLGFAPSFGFSRVDGSTPGLSASLEVTAPEPKHTGWGKLQGGIARANGPHVTLGSVRYTNRLWLARQPFDLGLWSGRKTAPLDRDDDGDPLAVAQAFLWGGGWTQYCRDDGFEGSLSHRHGWWRVSAGYRDLLQSPLRTTSTWNLFDQDLAMPGNLAATRGRTHELEYTATAHWPRLPLRTEIGYQTSSRRLGSDFEYRRLHAAAGLDLTLGRFASLVPQFSYGRLTGDLLPQASFYLGGGTMRSLRRDERGGSGLALAKLDLIGAQDLLALLRIPHPAALPLQGALFAATSAIWGLDPYSGTVVRGGDWPDRHDWRSEAGASLLYNSALFPTLHCSYAWPIGPGAREGRWSVSFTRPLDLLSAEPESGE
jgi:hypothetical protein